MNSNDYLWCHAISLTECNCSTEQLGCNNDLRLLWVYNVGKVQRYGNGVSNDVAWDV